MKFEIKVSHDTAMGAPQSVVPRVVKPVDSAAIADRMKSLLTAKGGQSGLTAQQRQAELEKLTAEATGEAPEAPEATDLVSELKDVLGDVVIFKFLAHGFHWNVQGINFQQFHDFFGAIYEDADASIDPLAENIRKCNATAPFLLTDYMEADYPGEFNTSSTDPVELSRILYIANEDVKESLQCAYDAAVAENEQGIANFIAERLDQHSKWQWQLRSIIGDVAANNIQSSED